MLQAAEQTHWAALLLDSSLSRTRRMKGLLLQLFCEHWSMMRALEEDQGALQSMCEANGILLSRRSGPESVEEAEAQMGSSRKRKIKHSRKHKKRKKHRRKDRSESEEGSDNEMLDYADAPYDSAASEAWDVSLGAYNMRCAFKGIPDAVASMSAWTRFAAYVNAHD